MKSSIATGATTSFIASNLKNRLIVYFIAVILSFQYSEIKSQNCNSCTIPAFPSLTIYHAIQTGPGMGFGIEAGSWNKDGGKFSYFFGTEVLWNNSTNYLSKDNQHSNSVMFSFYLKGQYKITNHLYVVAAPGVVNLSYFEFQAGLRYVIPVTHVIGIGIEPAYAVNQRQLVLNTNIHFALR